MGDTTKLGKIFIGGLSYETTDEKLRSYFGTYGTVTDAVVMKDPISRRSRGFGFITYADPSCVDRALAQPNHILDSRRVEAKRAVPRAESLRDIGNGSSSNRGNGSTSIASISATSGVGVTKKIFVGGLHYETKDGDFKKYFMQYGKVVSAEVMFNRETNKSRGFGFVIFESEASVESVLEEKNHVIDGKSVEVKRAVPRTDIPPPRSVSSRGGSFSCPSGPGSVGSLEDGNTATASVPSTMSTSIMGPDKLSRTSSASANLMPNGMLGGYAAAVRYGGRGLPRKASCRSMTSPRPLSNTGDTSNMNGISLDMSTITGVADALSSLVLGDGVSSHNIGMLGQSSCAPSPPRSGSSSSRGSGEYLIDAGATTTTNGHLSPLDVALHPLDNDPVIEQWNLSPSAGPQLSPSAPNGSPSESSYLPHGLVDDSTETTSNLSWQTTTWRQQSWGSPSVPLTKPQHQQQPPLPHPSGPFFSMFSNQHNSGTPLQGSQTWDGSYEPSTSSSGDGLGNGMMGMDLAVDGGFGGNDGSTFGMRSGNDHSASYSALSGFLHQEYLPSGHAHKLQQNEVGAVEHPLDSTSFSRMLSSERTEDVRKEPSSATEYSRQFR